MKRIFGWMIPVLLLFLGTAFCFLDGQRFLGIVAVAFTSALTGSLSIRISYTLRKIFVLWKYLIIGG